MHLFRRCSCAVDADADCGLHPWYYKFELGGQLHKASTRQTSKHKAGLVASKQQTAAIDVSQGIAPKRPAILLSKHVADYKVFAAADHPASFVKDDRVLTEFLRVVGDKKLDAVGAFDFDRYRTARGKTVSRGRKVGRATINREMNVLRGCFTWAVERDRLTKSPADAVANYETDDPAVMLITDAERAIILQKFPKHLALLFRVTLECLPRLSEVVNLTRDDLKPGGIDRRLKGGKRKVAKTTPALLADLRALLTRPEQRYVFANVAAARERSKREGKELPPTAAAMSVEITRTARAFGMRAISHHKARHTGATDMLNDGVSPIVVKEFGGWTSLRMLEKYGHANDAEAARAIGGTAARNAAALAASLPDDLSAGQSAAADPAATRSQKRTHGNRRSP